MTTLTLGSVDLPTLRRALADAGVRHNAYAELLWPHVEVASEPTAVQVRADTVGALGASAGATIEGLLSAVAPGLVACPLEVAVLLALTPFTDELPDGERLTIVSPRPTADEAAPRGFYLRRDADGLWLRAFVASDDWVFGPDERVVLAHARTTGR